MDEELGGVNLNSFFDQATETREMAETAQKTSNSNLSLLNELKERVRKIEIKLFDEEDKRQKEEMETKVKEQNKKSEGAVVENKEESSGTKGGGGGIIGFVTSFIGGLVGGTVGLVAQGIGGIIGLGTGLIKKGADFGKSLFKKIFGDKKKKDKGEVEPVVTPNNVMNLKLDDEDEDKNKRGDGAKNRGIGGLLGSVFGGNFSGDQQKNERGEYAFKNKNGGSTEVKPEVMDTVASSMNIKYSTRGNPETGEIEVDPNSLEPGVPLLRAQQHFYMSEIKQLQFEIRNAKMEYGDDYDTSFMEKKLEKFTKKYNDTLEFGGIDTKIDPSNKDEKKKKNIFGFNFGGLVQGYNQGGEVDSVPAMLTPGEFVVTKDAVEKVGADTLKGLNASVGATNKPSFLGSIGTDDEGNLETFVKFGEKSERVIESADGSYTMRNVTDMSGGGLDETTTTTYNQTFTNEDGTVTTLEEKKIMRERISSIGVPDLIEHQDQLLGEIHKLKGFENVTIDQVINSTTGIPTDKLLDILLKSDAQKVTSEKEDKAFKEDLKARGIKPGEGFNISANDEVGRSLAGTMGYRMGQIRPDMLVTSTTSFLDKSKSTFKTDVKPKSDSFLSDLSSSINESVKRYNEGGLVQGYNQGGLVGSSITPIIESKNESGEMKLIKNLSQSVDSNRQTLIVRQELDRVMNPPNQNPNPVALADTPQTAPAQLQETEAPIPFASLLRQSAQRYLNLGNNAMVIS